MPKNAKDFYRHPEVIKRMLEYCGVPDWITARADIGYPANHGPLRKSYNLRNLGKLMSTMYLVEYGVRVPTAQKFRAKETWQLGQILDKRADVFRAVHDEDNLICVMDVERVSHHFPGDNYLDMTRAFWCLEPFHQALMSVFRDFGFSPLVIATGQGYHYGFRVPKSEYAFELMQSIGFVTTSERRLNLYKRYGSKRRRFVQDSEAWAYDGWGKLAEFISNEAMWRARRFTNKLPVVIGDQYAGTRHGDVISVDLSAFGFPLHMRDVRLPFSLHQKHKVNPAKVGHEIARNTPYNIAVPRFTPCNNHELSLDDLFNNRRNYHNTAQYAGSVTTDLPEMTWGVERMIKAYKRSDVYNAHRYFDQGMEQFIGSDYKKHFQFNESFRGLPYHVKDALWHPTKNGNHLLKPDVIRNVTLAMLKKNWHPADIVALLAGKMDYFGLDVDLRKHCPIKWMTGWVRPFYVQTVTGTMDWHVTVDKYKRY